MAVTLQTPKPQSDEAPLWLPEHDAVVVDQSSARPPDQVDGYTSSSRLLTLLLGSRWKMATTISTALAAVFFLALLPSLFGAGIITLIKIAFYQAWTLVLLLLVTSRVRSISVGTVARFWLAGMFTVAMVASFVDDPLAGLASSSSVWITPILEEVLKAIPLGIAVFMGRRAWRHPGLSDLMVLGFTVGAGYSFHEEALWERGAVSGFDAFFGLVVPSAYRQDGVFVVGQAVWTSLIGLVVGLVILHRRHPGAVVAAMVVVIAVTADHMSVNATGDAFNFVRQLLFDGKLMALLFVVGVGAAMLLDRRRLASISARDHLFPSDWLQGSGVTRSDIPQDPLHGLLTSRYRRLRNGVHTTADAATQQWPPLCESHAAPVAELARLGRAADIAVGPGTSSSGWASDPASPDGFRFVGHRGFTVYTAGNTPVEMVVSPSTNSDIDEENQARRVEESTRDAARIVGPGPTVTSISTPKARTEATGTAHRQRAADFWQFFGLGGLGVGMYALVRLVTVSDTPTADLETIFALPEATNSPALIVGALGAVAAAVSIRGRDAAQLDAGWAVGPGSDPTPDRPDECEA